MGGDGKSPFNSYTPAFDASSSGGAGCIKIDFVTGQNLTGTVNGAYDSQGITIKLPADNLIELTSIYLAPKAEYSLSDIAGSDIGLYTTDGSAPKGYAVNGINSIPVESVQAPLFLNWPAEPDTFKNVTITVKSGATALQGATVSVTGTSKQGNSVDVTSEKTDANGQATVNLPYSNGNYTLKVNDVTVEDVSYTMTNSSGKSFAVDATATTDNVEYTDMKVVKHTYTIPIKVFDASGKPVDLTGAEISIGGTTATSSAAGEASVKRSEVGNNMELLVNVPGYQKVITGQAQINALPDGSGNDVLGSLSVGALNKPLAEIKVEGDAIADKFVKIVLKKVVTNVSIPLPVPKVGETPITVEQAKGLTATLTPVAGSSEALLAELGAAGNIVLTSANGDIQVEGVTTFAADAASLASAITITAPVPDGAYDMEITGAGFEPVKTTLTVFKAGSNTVANVGGTPSLDAGGAITALTGGVSKSEATTVDPDTGNSAITLENAVKENADVNVSDGTVSNGTDVAGGLTETDTAKGDLDIKVVTDPIYHVEVDVATDSTADAPVYEAQVYLKNAVTGYGTFGLYFDPKLFNPNSTFASTVTFNTEKSIAASDEPATQINAPAKDAGEPGYVFFSWQVAPGKPLIDASAEEVLVAKIRLPVRSESSITNNLGNLFDKRAIYTMDYAQTADGQAILSNPSLPGTDDPTYKDYLNDLMSSIWRTTELTGTDSAITLDSLKATRGGFYQIMVDDADLGSINSDIRMQFTLPDIATRLRADFHVVDKGGADIQNAEVKIYAKPESGEFDIETATPITDGTVKTDKTGHAAKTLDAGVYYYTVTHPSFWDYPNGTVLTESDGKDYDTFEIGEDKLITEGNNAADASNTAIVGEYITPVMDAKSYHKAKLSQVQTDGTTASAKTTAQLSGTASAYNGVDFTFSITPVAGYEWNFGADYADMAAVAAALSTKLYGTDKTVTAEAGMYQAGTAKTPTIAWDDGVKKFRITGANISGDAVGDVTFADGTTPEWFDHLRAGDLIIVAKDDMMCASDMTLTVTPGAGGKVEAKADETLGTNDITVTVGGSANDPAMPVAATADAVAETLKSGRTTSSVYTFTADEGNSIDKVIINGVEVSLTEAQKKAPYTYQFLNVSDDESITVTFADAEGTPISNPVVTLTLGADGGATKISYTQQDGTNVTNETLNGPASKTYVAQADAAFDVTLKAKDGYQLDTVLVDGAAAVLDSAKDDATGFYTKELVVSLKGSEAGQKMAVGESRTIVATFKKAEENAPSTQAIVLSSIQKGFGTISPVGTTIHTVGDTPTFTIVPQNNWELPEEKAIVVGGVDKTADVAAADAGIYKYTTEALPAGETHVIAALAEKRFSVKGCIKTQNGGTETKAKAKLIFTRPAITGGTDKVELTYESEAAVDVNNLMAFNLLVPAGTWEVQVKKAGYLDYIITDFVISEEASHTIYFGDGTDGTADDKTNGDMKPIELVPGDAFGEGRSIASNDIGAIVAGWVQNASAINVKKGDVNESGTVTTADMGYATGNYLKLRPRMSYTDFAASTPAPTP